MLCPVKGAWRPLEHGPRACAGAALSMVEMKIVLALAARSFSVEAACKSFDARDGKGAIQTANGARVHQ